MIDREKIKHKILDIIIPEVNTQKVFVAGWPASGSTFIYQVIKNLGLRAKKIHGNNLGQNNIITLYTFRDPRDVLCSMAKRQYDNLWQSNKEEAILKALKNLKRNEYDSGIFKSMKMNNVIMVRYENFFPSNQKHIIKFLADQFLVPLHEEGIKKIIKETSLEKNKERAKKFNNFNEFEREFHVHGNHISNKGKIGSWKDSINNNLREEIKNNIGELLIKLGYERNNNW
jgi:hypothetical protein